MYLSIYLFDIILVLGVVQILYVQLQDVQWASSEFCDLIHLLLFRDELSRFLIYGRKMAFMALR